MRASEVLHSFAGAVPAGRGGRGSRRAATFEQDSARLSNAKSDAIVIDAVSGGRCGRSGADLRVREIEFRLIDPGTIRSCPAKGSDGRLESSKDYWAHKRGADT